MKYTIISNGDRGASRAALDAANEVGLNYTGYTYQNYVGDYKLIPCYSDSEREHIIQNLYASDIVLVVSNKLHFNDDTINNPLAFVCDYSLYMNVPVFLLKPSKLDEVVKYIKDLKASAIYVIGEKEEKIEDKAKQVFVTLFNKLLE